MKNRTSLWLSHAITILMIWALGYYFYRDYFGDENTDIQTQSAGNSEATTTTAKIDIGSLGDSGDYKVEIIQDSQLSVKAPKLERPVVFPSSFSPQAQEIMKKNIETTITFLKNDRTNIDEWLNLAIYRKMLNDYKGAEEIWIYLTNVLKDPSYIYANLADLYGYYLKDPVKAEGYYKDAVRLEPGNVQYYFQFSHFYLDVLKDKGKALAIAEIGYEQNNTRPDFKNFLEQIKSRIQESKS